MYTELESIKCVRCIPELALEAVELRGAPEFIGGSEACSDGLPLRVKELIAHLQDIYIFITDKKEMKGT